MMKIPRILILTYHSLDSSGSVISVSPKVFERQMNFFYGKGYHTLSLSKTATILRSGGSFPDRVFVVTFDDGYQNVYTDAFPILDKYDFQASIFLVTDYCGKLNNWPSHSSLMERRVLLSWSEIREMHRHGFEFCAHTLTHPDLTRISIEEAEREIVQSKATIEDQIGRDVQAFAYPYGKYNPECKKIVEQHYLTACSAELGKVLPGDDLFRLKRMDMYYIPNRILLEALTTGYLDWYFTLRQMLRNIKNHVRQVERRNRPW